MSEHFRSKTENQEGTARLNKAGVKVRSWWRSYTVFLEAVSKTRGKR